MRTLWLVLAMLGWWLAPVRADGPPTRCLDTDSNETFPVSGGLTEEQLIGGRLPSIDRDANNHPTGLTWSEVPENWEARTERIGLCQGNAIYRCTYRKHDHPVDVGPAFDLIVYGYLAAKGEQRLVRPFCIVTNEETIGIYDDYFATSLREPFALHIGTSFKGTGDIRNHYVFVFTARAAFLRERSEGARHSPDETYIYNRAGKVISTRGARRD